MNEVDRRPGVVTLLALAVGTHAWPHDHPLTWSVTIWRSPTLTARFWNPIIGAKDSDFDNMRRFSRTTPWTSELQW